MNKVPKSLRSTDFNDEKHTKWLKPNGPYNNLLFSEYFFQICLYYNGRIIYSIVINCQIDINEVVCKVPCKTNFIKST